MEFLGNKSSLFLRNKLGGGNGRIIGMDNQDLAINQFHYALLFAKVGSLVGDSQNMRVEF